VGQYKRLWIILCVVVVASFSVLGYFGHRAISNAPPIPREVVTQDGRVLFGGETISDGQNVWQSIGGQQVGSVFGHGAYVAPDWTADWLHREAVYTLDAWARAEGGKDFESLNVERQASLRARLEREMRANTYDPATERLTVSAVRAEAIESLTAH
jgi:nitric oxide reductase subunit B